MGVVPLRKVRGIHAHILLGALGNVCGSNVLRYESSQLVVGDWALGQHNAVYPVHLWPGAWVQSVDTANASEFQGRVAMDEVRGDGGMSCVVGGLPADMAM